MAKKLISAIVLSTMLLSCVGAFAEEIETSVTEEEVTEEIPSEIEEVEEEDASVLELSLEDAINMALEKSPRVEAADAAITSAQLNLEVARDSKKEFDSMSKYVSVAVNVSDGLELGYLKHGYYTEAAQVGLELETIEKEQVLASIKYEVTEKYYNVKLMERLVEIARTGLQIAQDNSDVVKKNYELGYVSQLEVKNVDNAVLKAQHSVESYERNLDIAKESFKISLMIENDERELVLTDEISLPEMPENTDEKINGAMETRYDVTALKKAAALSERYFTITNYYVGASTAMYYSAYSDYLSSKYTYENSSKLIKLSLVNEYNSMVTAYDNVESCENELEIKNVEYESAKIKYEMGMITNLELTSIMAELDSAKVQLENAQVTYLLAVKKFEYNTTIGL